MNFVFGKEVKFKTFTDATGMTGILHKDNGDGTFAVLLVHGRAPYDGVLCSVVPINMPVDVIEEK